ncbi:MAG: discoidin domain-containing protein [Candidatus Eremiobacteraeota bacterium]|nr:discoidin domain-containing protein [Candidatus Eremiobacteraeota bacterium]
MIIRLTDFHKGIKKPAFVWPESNGFCAPEAEVMKNCFPLRDGSLTRRSGLTNVANFKYNADNSITCTRNIYWRPAGNRWVMGGNDGWIYTIEEGADIGATRIAPSVVADRITYAYDPDNSVFRFYGGNTWGIQFDSSGDWDYIDNTLLHRLAFGRGNFAYCKTAGVGDHKNRIYVDGHAGTYVDISAEDEEIITAGIVINSDIILILKRCGQGYLYVGYSGSGDIVRHIAENLGEVLPNCTVQTPYGLVFATSTDLYLVNKSPNVFNDLHLMNITDKKFQYPDTLLDADTTIIQEGVASWSDDITGGKTVSASSEWTGHEAEKAIDDDTVTDWQTDRTNLATGKTATASSNETGHTPDLAVDDDYSTSWQSQIAGAPSTEWLKIDLGDGNARAITLLALSSQELGSECENISSIQGSNNDADWDNISFTYIDSGGDAPQSHWIELNNTTDYRYYRINLDTVNHSGDYYTEIFEVVMYDDENGQDAWWKIDLGEGNAKAVRQFKLYNPKIADPWVFQGSNNDSDWSDITIEKTIHDGAWYYYYTIQNDNEYRYYRIKGKKGVFDRYFYMGFAEVILLTADSEDRYVTGKKFTATYYPVAKEYWISIRDTDGNWKTYVYNFPLDCFWEFESGAWDGGSYGLKNGELYLALNSFTPDGGDPQPAGLWKYGEPDTADPDGAFTVQYRTGWIELRGARNLEMNLRQVYIEGGGWSTCKVYYQVDDSVDGSISFDISGQVNPRLYPSGGLRLKRFKIEFISSVDVDEGDKDIYLKEVDFELEEIRT